MRDVERRTGSAGPHPKPLAACLAAVLATASAALGGGPDAASWSAARFGEHDALPPVDAATLARTYGRASEVPGVATLADPERRTLVEAAAARHSDRLLERGTATGHHHADRLAQSVAGRKRPEVVASACARHGIVDGPCTGYAGYTRRAGVLAEMLAANQLTLTQLATDLSVAPQVRLADPGESPHSVADDVLPAGTPAEVATRYASSLSVPGLASWPVSRRIELLDAATARRKDRLAALEPALPFADRRAYVKRLAKSALGRTRPTAVRQACAHLGIEDGPCTAHGGYVRRALVLEAMLARPGTTPDGLHAELTEASPVRSGPGPEAVGRRYPR